MLVREPTQAEADAFTAFMASHFDVSIIDKDDAVEMQIAGSFLDALGIIDKELFFSSYTTTIGNKIYMPTNTSPWNRIFILPHEVTHTLQFRKDGFAPLSWAYLTDQEQRSMLEAEAYVVSSEMHFWRYGTPIDTQWVVDSLANYALDENHREVVRTYVNAASVTVAAGGIGHEASKIAIAWLNEHVAD